MRLQSLRQLANSSNSALRSPPAQLMDGGGHALQQPLITNYFGLGQGNVLTTTTLEEEGELPHFNNDEIEYHQDGNEFTATVQGIGLVGDLSLMDDDGVKWINGISSKVERRGIGTELLRKAIQAFGTIYASNMPDGEEDDSRHLTDKGFNLVQKCIDQYEMEIVFATPGMVHADDEEGDEEGEGDEEMGLEDVE
jgi:hypothetical protein